MKRMIPDKTASVRSFKSRNAKTAAVNLNSVPRGGIRL